MSEENKASVEQVYTREQLAVSERFAMYRDLVLALTTEGERLTVKAMDKKIGSFLNKKM
jgi:hypothetical protein